ncbi:hypothetical protein EsH8_X_000144 [Colletotrichum jinshuiense]
MASESYYRSISDDGPYSFLFYIVARVGAAGRHRPVAVALRDDSEVQDHLFGGTRVIEACLQVILNLSAPANRAAIKAELGLATEFYAKGDDIVARVYLPEPDIEASAELGLLDFGDEEENNTERPWDEGLREFPFITTNLLVGLGYDASRCKAYNPRTEPLGMAFKDATLHHGMVVIDISDLDKIRYGIVAFTLHHMAEVNVPPHRHYDPVEDDPPDDDPTPMLQEDRPRTPLSATGYMTKFSYNDFEGHGRGIKELELHHQVIDPTAMDFIWPSDDIDLGNSIPQELSSNSLADQAVRSLIEGTQETETYDMSSFDGPLKLSGFRESLRRRILESPESLGPTIAAGQLLRLIYEKQHDLNWVQFKNLSYESVAAAIESPELQEAISLSLCIDRIKGNPESLLKTLCRLDTVLDICFLQEPTRANDEASAHIYLLISTNPEYTQLLQSKAITVTASYSAPLRKRFWLPTTGYTQPIKAYPIQQMFVRHELQKPAKKFWPNYFYLGDGLLGPERFAAGFVAYLRSLCNDENLFSFSCAPCSLQDLSEIKISPILAEVFSIPVQPIATRGYAAEIRNECWSMPRDLDQGAWNVLVSHERNDELDLGLGQSSSSPWPPTAATPLLRYAFVRTCRRIEIKNDSNIIKPKDIEICDLVGFLKATAPQVNTELVTNLLDHVAEDISKKTIAFCKSQGKPPPMMHSSIGWVSALDAASACSILQEFLDDAALVRRNIRLAMAEQPQDRDWYPELRTATSSKDTELPQRRGIFVARYESRIA